MSHLPAVCSIGCLPSAVSVSLLFSDLQMVPRTFIQAADKFKSMAVVRTEGTWRSE